MKTSASHPIEYSDKNRKRSKIVQVYNNLLEEFKSRQTGYSTIAIIAQSCLGSAAAMLLLMSNMQDLYKMILVFFVTILCMAYNAAVLAQLNSKITFNLLLISLLFSALIIIANLI
ncbi:hypothetical protein [Maribacter sp. MMG018]|uniref:hypothetical protein n=1 Tax=Maribacter sp. MMG018 TaxID=2822688 RepID=UPI001FFD7EEE|nr:hypothetical protein [Maribacter sp. MMG018]